MSDKDITTLAGNEEFNPELDPTLTNRVKWYGNKITEDSKHRLVTDNQITNWSICYYNEDGGPAYERYKYPTPVDIYGTSSIYYTPYYLHISQGSSVYEPGGTYTEYSGDTCNGMILLSVGDYYDIESVMRMETLVIRPDTSPGPNMRVSADTIYSEIDIENRIDLEWDYPSHFTDQDIKVISTLRINDIDKIKSLHKKSDYMLSETNSDISFPIMTYEVSERYFYDELLQEISNSGNEWEYINGLNSQISEDEVSKTNILSINVHYNYDNIQYIDYKDVKGNIYGDHPYCKVLPEYIMTVNAIIDTPKGLSNSLYFCAGHSDAVNDSMMAYTPISTLGVAELPQYYNGSSDEYLFVSPAIIGAVEYRDTNPYKGAQNEPESSYMNNLFISDFPEGQYTGFIYIDGVKVTGYGSLFRTGALIPGVSVSANLSYKDMYIYALEWNAVDANDLSKVEKYINYCHYEKQANNTYDMKLGDWKKIEYL